MSSKPPKGKPPKRKPPKGASVPAGDADVKCAIIKITGMDSEGRPVFGEPSEELCRVLKRPGDDTDISARIGSSPDHPLAPPRREDAVLLLRITTTAGVDDVLELLGLRFKVIATSPTYDSIGKLAYHVVRAEPCDPEIKDIGRQ